MVWRIGSFLSLFIALGFSTSLRASETAAARLRQLIEVTEAERDELAKLRDGVKLRVTRGFHQGGSQLCWGFATINMLESNYLEANPEVDATQVELSRWYIGKLAGSTQRRGTSIDAINHYMARGGLVAEADYPQFGPSPPSKTIFMNREFTPRELLGEISGAQVYWSYGFSDDQSGWSRHPDPDALEGTQSFFVSRARMGDLISASVISSRKAVTYTEGGHIVQIYGVTRDPQGQPKFYHVKDSYSPYFYDASASRVHLNGFEVTTVADLAN